MHLCERIALVLLFPLGMFAVLPWLFQETLGPIFLWSSPRAAAVGIAISAVGALILAKCLWDYAFFGIGTPSLALRPTRLGTAGPSAVSRNPVYLAVAVCVTGEALAVQVGTVAVYAAAVWIAVAVGVIAFEEPALRRMFGVAFDTYRSRTPRWLGRKYRPQRARPGRV